MQLNFIQPALASTPAIDRTDSLALHDAFWSALGVRVCRRGVCAPAPDDAKLYLLLDRDEMLVCDAHRVLDDFHREKPTVMFLRGYVRSDEQYVETINADASGRFLGFERRYKAPTARFTRAALTSSASLRHEWEASPDTRQTWRDLRRSVNRVRRRYRPVEVAKPATPGAWSILSVADRPDGFSRPSPHAMTTASRAIKRLVDIIGALVGLAMSLPLYPLIMVAIWLQDGWPVFFAHRRESLGGRPFNCYKFRSMRRDADQIKAELASVNEADGPQFFMEEDPRLTRLGRFLRETKIDELPQFYNVLVGHMSLVGPRPSPFSENQLCPAWRMARLSVRPGITGLWQIKRSRQPGLDFQEWIRYDIEYVENQSLWLDFKIIVKTAALMGRSILEAFQHMLASLRKRSRQVAKA